jgi:hypothetical protein
MPHRPLKPGLFIAEPTATTRLQTQRFLFASDEEPHDDFANAQWSDSLPQLVQAKLLQSFENYDVAHAPLRGDALGEGGVRLVIDLRRFDIATAPELKATIAFSANRRWLRASQGCAHLRTILSNGRDDGNTSGNRIWPDIRSALARCCEMDGIGAVKSAGARKDHE